MKFLDLADWLFMSANVFGALCLLYAAYCLLSNWLYARRYAAYRLRELQNYIGRASKENQQMSHLLEHARARELELTEERNRLRDRAALFAKIIKDDDICSDNKLTRLWKK